MKIEIEFEGAKNISDALAELGKLGGRDATAMRDGLAEGARQWRDAIKTEIKGLQIKDKTGNLIKGVVVRKRVVRRYQVQVSVVSSAPHSNLLEYGTVERYRGVQIEKRNRAARRAEMGRRKESGVRTGYTGKVKAYGFMRRVFQRDQESVLKTIRTGAWKYIDKETQRVRRRAAK